MDHSEKLKLYGFNNLTKALSFNIYDVCYAKTPREQKDYIAYIDQQYNSERLTRILPLISCFIMNFMIHLPPVIEELPRDSIPCYLAAAPPVI
jgi:hypothetical protein